MKLPKTYRALLDRANKAMLGIVDSSDTRAADALCTRGLLKHIGGSRRVGSGTYQITDAGRAACGVKGLDDAQP